MKLSVITPCYNYGRFLPDAVRSVHEQICLPAKSAANFTQPFNFKVEHIVIDACSTDGTPQWLASYAEKVNGKNPEGEYTFFFISEKDAGQTDAINKGLRMATGDVVCWLNADEYYLPGVLKKVAEAFIANPDVDLIYGEPLYVDQNKKPIRIKRDHRFDPTILLYCGCYITSCCTFWRRRVLDAGHYLNESYRVTMDFEYFVRLMKLGYRFLFVPEVIAAFTWHNENVSEVLSGLRRQERLRVQQKYGYHFTQNPRWQILFFDIANRILRFKRLYLRMLRMFDKGKV